MKLELKEWVHAIVWVYRHIVGKTVPMEIKAISRIIKEDDTVIDIGAHAGAWSFSLSKLTRQGRVFAVEALPYYASVLKKCKTILKRSNVEVINKAITAESKNVRIVWTDALGNRLTGFTHIAGPDEIEGRMIEVVGQALDEMLNDHDGRVTFIKCDVEGAEVGVLLGSKRTIKKWRPLFFLEVNPSMIRRYNESADFVFRFFEEYKYAAFYIDTEGKIQKIDSIAGFTGNDILFVPDEKSYCVQ